MTTIATGLQFPYGMHLLPDGSLLVATSNPASFTLFSSTLQIKRITMAANGSANPPATVFNGGPGPATGMAGAGNVVAVATGSNNASRILILKADDNGGGALSELGSIAFQYPAGGWQHDAHTVALRAVPGQAGAYQLLFGIGSQANNVAAPPTAQIAASGLLSQNLAPESLYSVRFSVSGSAIQAQPAVQLAKGLRNPFSLGFTQAGDIYLSDNGQNIGETDIATSADVFDIIPASAAAPLNFGFPGTYADANTGAIVGPVAGITTPAAAFIPLNGVRRQGSAGLALSPPGFPAGLNNGVFIGFFGSGDGHSMNPLVYLNPATGQYFDFIPGGEAGVSRLVSMVSSDAALYVADLASTGSLFAPATGAIYKIAAGATPPAAGLDSDRATQGSWQGKYGSEGYAIAGGVRSLPAFASVEAGSVYTWAGLTSEARALQSGVGSANRVAATYLPDNYSNALDFRIAINDPVKAHRVALYFLDWDTTSRSQVITVSDAATHQVLDTRTISAFANGEYAIWNLRGEFDFHVAGVGVSPVLSGVFIDPAGATGSAPGFALSATAAGAAAGSVATSYLSVLPSNGFQSSVSFAAANWPVGITGVFGASSVAITVASTVAPGSYSLTVIGTSGTLTASTTIALVVSAAPSFTLTATPASNGMSAITVIPANGFNAPVTLAASNWPVGITGVFGASSVAITVASTVAPGSYSLTVMGTSGALSASTAIALVVSAAPSFTLTATPASNGMSAITVIPANGFNAPVTLAASNWPVGITGVFGPSSVAITVASTVAPGSYSLTVVGTSGALSSSTTIALMVSAAPSFTLTATPASNGMSAITVIPANGFNAPVTLAASNWPGGITGVFGASSVAITVASTVAPGSYSLTVVGTSGALSSSTTIALVVSAAPSFTLTATPASNGMSAITVIPANGFNAPVALAASNWPAGITGVFGASSVAITVASTVAPGSYSLTVIGTNGALSASTTIALVVSAVPSFTLTATPPSNGTSTITVVPANGFNAPVALAASNWPVGITGVFGPSSVAITVASTVAPGSYSLTVIGTSGALSASTTIALVVSAAPSFTLTATPASNGMYAITVIPANGFNAPVALAASNWPVGITGVFGASSVAITVASTVAPGSYSLTVIGTSGALSASTTIALTVNAPPTFTLTATPPSNGMSAITVIPANGFNAPVTLAASNWPVGITGVFGPSSVAITVASTVAPGSYPLTVIGSSGALTASTTIALVVSAAPSFTLTATPASNGMSAITVVPANGFNAPVTLAASNWPVGITGVFGASSVAITVASTVAPGSYSLTVIGTSGALTASTTIALVISAAPSFTLTATPASNGMSAITVIPANGFNAPVTLAASNWPVGITGVFGASSVAITVASTVAPGSYSLTVIGTSGALTASTTIALVVSAAPSFTLTATPASNGMSAITVVPANGFNSPVTLAPSNWPAGITGVFGTSSVAITVASTVAQGSYSLTVIGTSGALSASTTIPLTVNAPPSFTLTATPPANGTSTITVFPANGFNSPVTLAASNWPVGITGVFGASSVAITVASTVAPGSYSLTVIGTSGALSASTTIALVVSAAPSFTLTATPASNGMSAITVIPANGFNAPVALAASNWPAGITGVFGASSVAITVASTVAPGSYSLTVIGTNGALSASTTIALVVSAAPSFTLTATPASNGMSAITVIPANGFNAPVALAASNWPAGITGVFGASSVAITVASTVAPGSYSLTVIGTSGTLSASTTIPLTVNAPPTFTLTATPPSNGTSTITVVPANGFNAPVALTASNWPAGITGVFGTSTVAIAVASTVAPGSYSLTVIGSSGALSASTTIPLTVNAPPTFTLTATPPSNGTSTITVVPANGFNAPVALTASNWPAGITGVFGTSTVAIAVASTVAPGSYSLTVIGSSGALSASTTIPLTVNAPPTFTLTATPPSNGTSTITVVPANGFNAPVTLAASNWPVGITGVFGASSVAITVASTVAPGSYSLTVIGTSGALSASTTIPLTVSAAGPSASYVAVDSATRGAWSGKYGADGYLIANGATSLPTYATFASTGASTFTWAQSTTDSRALQVSRTSASGIASSYYSTYSNAFTFSLNLSDSNTHEVAIYLLDWDTTLRSQNITIRDAATNAILDSRSFSGFHDGQYAVWNLKGNLTIQVAATGGPSAVVSGIFFGSANGNPGQPGFTLSATPTGATAGSAAGASTVTVTPLNGFSAPVTLTASGWPAGITATFAANPATSGSTVAIQAASAVAPGTYSLPVIGTSGALAVTTSIPFTVTAPAAASGPSATFSGLDDATKGAWIGRYGGAGYLVPNGPASAPAFASLNFGGALNYTWAAQTNDVRALRLSAGSTLGIASSYTQYLNTSLNIGLSVSDNNTHQLALYLLDWDTTTRSQTVTIVNTLTNAVLDAQTISNFHDGVYAVWNFTGNITIRITGTSPVVSGVFFN